jgi:hypothetical protein
MEDVMDELKLEPLEPLELPESKEQQVDASGFIILRNVA